LRGCSSRCTPAPSLAAPAPAPFAACAEAPLLLPDAPLALAPPGGAAAAGPTEATTSLSVNACSASHWPYGRIVV